MIFGSDISADQQTITIKHPQNLSDEKLPKTMTIIMIDFSMKWKYLTIITSKNKEYC